MTGTAAQRSLKTPPPGGVLLSALRRVLMATLVALLAGACAGPAADGGRGAAAAAGRAATGMQSDGGPLPIGVVQGTGPTSPWQDREVTVEGVVTAALPGLDGFTVQDPVGDGEPRSSDAIFVLAQRGLALPAAGSRVRVSGRVTEGGQPPATLTTLVASQVQVTGAGTPLQARVLDAPPPDWEALESVEVRIAAPLTVTGNHALHRFGELALAFGGRLWQPTERHRPGPAARALADENARRMLLLDDADTRQWPRALPFLPALEASAPLRAGSVLEGVQGVPEQRFGHWRLQPTQPVSRVRQAPRPPVPTVPGAHRIAAFNVLNFFNGDGRGAGFPTSRGADTAAAHARQRDKLVAALLALDADVLGLLEIENDGDGPHSSVAELAQALSVASGRRHHVVASPAPGGDAIRVALLWREGRVRPVGPPAQLDQGPFAYGSRPPLAQAFDIGGGDPLVVVVNHFKSKGGCAEASGADRDSGDGQGCWNAARVAAAEALAGWLAADPTGTGGDRVLVLGDLNAYSGEDPLQALAAHGLHDLLGADDWSYVYDGRAGRLDHALASASARRLVAGAAIWHANADENTGFDYRFEGPLEPALYRPDPWRASDHDAVLVGLR